MASYDFREITRQAVTAAVAHARTTGVTLYQAEQVAEMAMTFVPADAAAAYAAKYGETMFRTLSNTATLGA